MRKTPMDQKDFSLLNLVGIFMFNTLVIFLNNILNNLIGI